MAMAPHARGAGRFDYRRLRPACFAEEDKGYG